MENINIRRKAEEREIELTFVRFTFLPTSILLKNLSMLGPILSYEGTGA